MVVGVVRPFVCEETRVTRYHSGGTLNAGLRLVLGGYRPRRARRAEIVYAGVGRKLGIQAERPNLGM